MLVEDEVKGDENEVKIFEGVNNEKGVKMKENKDIVELNNLKVKPGYATVGRIDEITNAPIHENLDDSLKLCEKQINKNNKLEVGHDGVNVCKAMGCDENEQLDNPKITKAEQAF